LDISGIVLAGGRSLRLGREKVSETVGNKSLLERAILRLSSLVSDIIIVVATEQSFLQFIDYPKLRVVADVYHGKGPLGGIYTGLAASDSFHSLVVASDMPFLNQNLLSYMMHLAPSFDLVIPRLGDMVEPLHTVYSQNCLTHIEQLLRQNNLGALELISRVNVRYVDVMEINRFDPEHLSFFNINTEEDLKKARELVTGDMGDDKC
jgi:molybdopterin-guanine dinucleotide biosynthesis protein A